MMGRKRDNASKPWAHLKGVYRKRNTLIYREYRGVVGGKPSFAPDIYLCDLDASPSKMHAAYERVTQQDSDTVSWLLRQYHASPQFQALAQRTRREYEDYQTRLTSHVCKNRLPLGKAPLAAVKRTTIRSYLDNYGAPIAANRHIQYLKAAWNWALERFEWLPENPCQGVRLNEQSPRERYVTREEYAAIHPLTSGWVYWAMELAYLCRARRSEIVSLRVSDITEDGLRLRRGKGSEGEITRWTPRLRAAVDGAQRHSYGEATPIGDAILLLNNHGSRITDRAWNSALGRLRPKMDALGIERFTLHDLKAAGMSNQEDNYGGHRSERMRRVYVRKLQLINPPD